MASSSILTRLTTLTALACLALAVGCGGGESGDGEAIQNPPEIISAAPTEATEGVEYRYEVVCTDADGDDVALAAGAADSCGGTVTDNMDGTGIYTFTPNELQGGTGCTVSIVCSDDGSKGHQAVQVRVVENNQPLAITNLPATESGHWGQGDAFVVETSDGDSPPDSFTYSIAATSCSFVPGIDESTGEVSWGCASVETCTVDVTVTDSGTPSTSDTATLTIMCTNTAPVIASLAESQASEHDSYAYDVVCIDTDGDPVTLERGGEDSCGGTLVDNGDGTGLYSFVASESQGGTSCTVQVGCSDSQESVTETTVVTIAEVNEPPAITSSPPSSETTEGVAYSYDVTCLDADGDSASLTVAPTDSCGGALTDNGDGTGQYTFAATELQGGRPCAVGISCSDGQQTVAQVFTVNVIEDNQPVSITNLPATESGHWGQQDSFTVRASDADLPQNAISFALSNVTCTFGPVIDSATGRISWTCGGPESCTADVTVTDSASPSSSDSQRLTIECNNTAPAIVSVAPAAIAEGQSYSYSIVCVDGDGDAVTLAMGVSDTCAGTLTDNGDGTGTYGFATDEASGGTSCDIQLICSDTQADATQATTVAIAEDNQAPSITSQPASTAATEGVEYSYDVSCADSDGDAVTLAVAAADTCGGTVTVTAGGAGRYAFVPTELLGGTSCSVVLQCSDGSETIAQAFAVTVAEDNQPVTIENLPATVSGHANLPQHYLVQASDPDSPATTLTFATGSSTCTFDPAVASSGEVSWSCGGAETCTVEVSVTDGGTPSATGTLTIECTNAAPAITSSAPSSVPETSDYGYSITCSDNDGDVLTLQRGGGDSCGGTLVDHHDGTGVYSFPTDEEDGGVSCDVQVTCSDTWDVATETVTVSITEVNLPPLIDNLPAGVAVEKNQAGSFDANGSDSDLPLQNLAWSIASETCTFSAAIDASTGQISWTCGSLAESCTISVSLSDGVASTEGDLAVQCVANTSPQVGAGPSSAIAGVAYRYDIVCTDVDGDDLTLGMGLADSCGGALVDNGDGTGIYAFIPERGQPGGSCTVGVTCSDGEDTTEQSTVVTIYAANTSPRWTRLPIDPVFEADTYYNYVFGVATDSDVPNAHPGDPGYLTCSLHQNECSFEVTVSGGGPGAANCRVSLQTGSTGETCVFVLEVSDGLGAAIRQALLVMVKTLPTGIVYVDQLATGAEDGTSWEDAYTDLQTGVDNAAAGAWVWVASGIYLATGTDPVLIMAEGVEIFGGFAGSESDLLQRHPADHPAVLDGGQQSYHVVVGATGARLDGFIITGGMANGTGGDCPPCNEQKGAGMFNDEITALIVSNCTFSDNVSSMDAGAIYNRRSSPTISNCRFLRNTADFGGAIFNWDEASPEIVGCTFSDNQAHSQGGAIYSKDDASPPIRYSFFRDNSSNAGGAISNWLNSSPSIAHCSFSGNSAEWGGGAIFNLEGCSPTIEDSDFVGNSAEWGGGAIFNLEGCSPTIRDSDFVNNSADHPTDPTRGGAIFSQIAPLEVQGSRFEGNSADYGGAVFGGGPGDISEEPQGSSSFIDCSFTGNRADNETKNIGMGGAILTWRQALVTIQRCTFQHNSARTQGGAVYSHEITLASIEGCTFRGNSAGTSQLFDGGGAIFNFWYSSPSIVDCTFVENTAYGQGGAIYNNLNAAPDIANCTFRGNSAGTSQQFDGGGAVYNNWYSSPTITDCDFVENTAYPQGGAIYNTVNSSPEITRCTFTGNGAGGYKHFPGGGAIFNNFSCSPPITDCTFTGNWTSGQGGAIYNNNSCDSVIVGGSYSGNTAEGEGGAMYNLYSAPTITGANFSSNTASDGGAVFINGPNLSNGSNASFAGCMFQNNTAEGQAGAMHNFYSDTTITGTTFSNNTASDGGAVFNQGGNASFAGCMFQNNTAEGQAGAMHNFYSASSITWTTFSSNTASDGGAVFNHSSNGASFAGCIFRNNTAGTGNLYDWGGAVYNHNSSLTYENCLFAGNTTYTCGGAMYNYATSSTITNCTFADNIVANDDADSGGYGAAICNNGGATATITNCILWDNSAAVSGNDIDNFDGASATVTHSDIEMGDGNTGNIQQIPQFVGSGDYHIVEGSPCQDAGTATGAPADDLDSNGRPACDGYDMGAYEVQTCPP